MIDKPRIYHQLIPMEVQYEYGTTKVCEKWAIGFFIYITATDYIQFNIIKYKFNIICGTS